MAIRLAANAHNISEWNTDSTKFTARPNTQGPSWMTGWELSFVLSFNCWFSIIVNWLNWGWALQLLLIRLIIVLQTEVCCYNNNKILVCMQWVGHVHACSIYSQRSWSGAAACSLLWWADWTEAWSSNSCSLDSSLSLKYVALIIIIDNA